LVIGATERDELVKLRQEALQAMNPKQIRDAPNGASSDSGEPASFEAPSDSGNSPTLVQ
jgi:hypothetical protein